MSWFVLILSALVCILSLLMFIEVSRGWRRIARLKDLSAELEGAPRVSIVFSALNEENHIEAALRSMLAIDYPNLEVIAIDDRSTDATGTILDRLAAEFPVSAEAGIQRTLRVLHIRDLPSGWLGKSHALHQGAQIATGEYLLFTDADVLFEPTAVRRAVGHCLREKLDHLTIFPQFLVRGPLLAMLMLSQRGGFMAQSKPWRVRTSQDASAGQGTFNLVRAEAYRSSGGFQAIPLAVFEDLVLGFLLKKSGLQADVLFGDGMVRTEWYPSAWAMIRGLQKNTFAAFNYSLVGLTIASLMMLLLRVWPWAGLLVTGGAAWWINLATVLAEAFFYFDLNRSTRWPPSALVFLPVISLVSVLMWWTASVRTLLRGGVEWRGTLYPLDELRKAL